MKKAVRLCVFTRRFLSFLGLVILAGTAGATSVAASDDVIDSPACEYANFADPDAIKTFFSVSDAPAGFTPPRSKCSAYFLTVTQALVLFSNIETGEQVYANSGGWLPGPGWVQGLWPEDCSGDNRNISSGPDDDDDRDGWTNLEEVIAGTNPLDPTSCKTGCDNSFDIDGDLKVMPLTDGLLILRHLFGFTGASLTTGAIGDNAVRTSAAAITDYLNKAKLNVDQDASARPLTDGLLVIRYLFGFRGEGLVSGAVPDPAYGPCQDAPTIESFIQSRFPAG